MRSDQLKGLFRAFKDSDDKRFNEIAAQIIDDEEQRNHHQIADDLREIVDPRAKRSSINGGNHRIRSEIPIPRDTGKGFPLLEVRENYYSMKDLILREEMRDRIVDVSREFSKRDVLASFGLKPRQKILFYGEPGTGKTLTAMILANELNLKLIHVRFDSIVSSYLGETATNMRKVFDFINEGEWVVLFDEFDIIAKNRDDPHEHGEIKRVVNNFMQMLDSFEGTSLIIAATNHPHLLDKAIWRRFDDAILFEMPTRDLREKLFTKYLGVMKKADDLSKRISELAESTDGFSPSDIQQTSVDALRHSIINGRNEITYHDVELSLLRHKNKKKSIMEA